MQLREGNGAWVSSGAHCQRKMPPCGVLVPQLGSQALFVRALAPVRAAPFSRINVHQDLGLSCSCRASPWPRCGMLDAGCQESLALRLNMANSAPRKLSPRPTPEFNWFCNYPFLSLEISLFHRSEVLATAGCPDGLVPLGVKEYIPTIAYLAL